MRRANAAASEDAAVSRVDEDQTTRPRQVTQHIASISASLGAVAAGLVFGWTSPAGEDGINLRYSFVIDPVEFSWISAAFALGAVMICVPIGILNDLIGRRRAMLSLVVPFSIGWACVIWPDSVTTLIIGRLILGASSGALFVIAPMYTAEISDSETRGTLGSYFQLLISAGILGSYVLGLLDSMAAQSQMSAVMPIIFFVIFFFMPETPTYHLMKGDVEAARKTLHWLRGSHYDVEYELKEKIEALAEAERNKVSFVVAIRSRAAWKGLVIAFGLMFFQAFCGIDAIIFYVGDIFVETTDFDSNLSSIGVGATQIVAVFLMSFVIDKWGRRLLLMISGSVMSISTLVLGGYFYFQQSGTSMDNLQWLPLVCISCFVAFFYVGYASIPWMMIGELFSPQIKAVAASSACMAGWIMIFIVVKFYDFGKSSIGPHGMFWTFSAINALSNVFVYFVVPETKNKTLEQIQIELRGNVRSDGRSESTKL